MEKIKIAYQKPELFDFNLKSAEGTNSCADGTTPNVGCLPGSGNGEGCFSGNTAGCALGSANVAGCGAGTAP